MEKETGNTEAQDQPDECDCHICVTAKEIGIDPQAFSERFVRTLRMEIMDAVRHGMDRAKLIHLEEGLEGENLGRYKSLVTVIVIKELLDEAIKISKISEMETPVIMRIFSTALINQMSEEDEEVVKSRFNEEATT